jgi:hypothetical protein
MNDFLKMNNNQAVQSSDQKDKNNYHAIGCLKDECIYIDLGILLAWSLSHFIKRFNYGSEAAVSFNG